MTVGLCAIDGNNSADLMEDHGSEIVSDTSVYWDAAVARLDSVTDIRYGKRRHTLYRVFSLNCPFRRFNSILFMILINN